MKTHTLDITGEHCPMTFVKTKLKLEEINSGDILEVTLKGQEPLENIPRSAEEDGYEILDITHENGNIHKVTIKK